MEHGHSTCSALSILEKEIEREVHQYQHQSGHFNWLSALHHDNKTSVLHWPGIALLLALLTTIIACYLHGESSMGLSMLIVEFIIIALLLCFGIYVVMLNSYIRHNEMIFAFQNLLVELKDFKHKCHWEAGSYPDLELPFSPAINLQWTYRDGHRVNLPWALLVKGDIIVLHPGQKSPGKCIACDLEDASQRLELDENEFYSPEIEEGEKESFNTPRAKKPLPVKEFILLETPYIYNVRIALTKSLDRPATFCEKELFLVKNCYLERIVIPMLLIIVIGLNAFRYFHLKASFSNWVEMILLQPFHVILPLLPLKLPICYHILNLYGISRLINVYNSMKAELAKSDSQISDHSVSSEFISHPTDKVIHTWKLFRHLLFGNSLYGNFWLCRTSNLLHTLGSMSSLCCIDKKGLLSWPNPTAEKVFFFKHPSNTPEPSSSESLYKSTSSVPKFDDVSAEDNGKTAKHYGEHLMPHDDSSLKTGHQGTSCFYYPESKVEVLDLTHNNRLPFALQFDDPHWKQYLTSLKPLGLNILLNTCNPESQPEYIKFCSYLAREAMSNEITIPTINRRCLCELSEQIGFVEHAAEVFQFEKQLSFFRHIQEDIVRKDKLTRSLDVKKLKCAMPNAVSVITRDLLTGTPQLMSQGTADILVDLCSEYWDGSDLLPISHTERKKILDFYHRYSLTAYCTAFSYRPITAPLNDQFGSVYFELPPNYNQFFHHSFNTSPLRSWDRNSKNCRLKMLHYLSTDSIFLYENAEDSMKDPKISLQQVCNQIFIGMVAMQYQARSDIVRLIEQLDDACIRFVHFSKENELRSRVFSEKMGLESGWNCHVSLLSDDCRCDDNKAESKQSVFPGVSTKPSLSSISNRADTAKSSKKYLAADCYDGNQKFYRSHSAPIDVHYEIDSNAKYCDTTSKENSVQVSSNHSSLELSSMLQASSTLNLPEDNSQLNEVNSLQSYEINESSHLLGEEIELKVLNEDEQTEIVSVDEVNESDSSDQSGDVGFDMSNRSKLPKGIKNIRPHLEKIDNVPLLVSLFTDCTPETTKQMIEIMQEHDEIVCCIGSVANFHNMAVFLQSDASIGIQPLYPQICMKKPVIKKHTPPSIISPTKMSAMLNSIACALTYHRDMPIDLYQLIIEAKHYMLSMKTCFFLMLSCCLTVTLTQLFANLLLLPPILTGNQILWLTCLIIPVISLPIVNNPKDCRIMTYAAGKNVRSYERQASSLTAFYFFSRFFPTIVVCLLCFGLSFQELCKDTKSPQISCHLFTGLLNQTLLSESDDARVSYNLSLYTAQSLVTFCLALYFVLTSASFVHPFYPLWKKNIFKNKLWLISFVLVIISQIIFTTTDLLINTNSSNAVVHHIPYYIWIIIFLWAILIIPINELVKSHEIRMNIRLQKRARLEFGTKLGMNSPF